eukprot:Skav235088  [mRNA]  locus=scaffold711:46657:47550:- [translate_table: standard]
MEGADSNLPKETEAAFRQAARDFPEISETPGITWEEIAPPAETEDGCFKTLRHTWSAIYSEVLLTTAPSVRVSKAGTDA